MEDFQSKYSGEQVEGMLDQIASGEAGGGGGGITVETDPIFSASPASSITTGKIAEWDNKVDKVTGKGLSTEDFTTLLKTKLEGLSNYDDEEIQNALASLQTQFNTLVSGNASTAIESFNEIIAFLDRVQDTEDLASIIASIEQQIAGVNSSLSAELAKKPNKTDIATINGKSIINGGNITIEGGEGSLDSEVVSSTEASEEFPQVLYVEQTLTEAQKSQARKNIGADNTELKEQITELSEANEVLKEAQQFTDVAIKDLQDMKIDRENDDYYPKMAVGLADNLAGVDVVDSEINFRRSGGGAISDGVARIENIKGNSVVWNQLLIHHSTESNRIQVESDGVTYAIGGEITDILFQKVGQTTHSMIAGHKYYIRYEVLSGNLVADVNHVIFNGSTRIQPKKGIFITADSTTAVEFSMRVTPEALGSKFHFAFYDLTQMFGAGNEPTTIEEFYQRIPMGVDMNAYNEGEVIHMNVQSIESVGVNQWDEEWELGSINTTTGENTTNTSNFRCTNYIDIIGGAKYYGYNAGKDSAGNYYAWGLLYDSDKKLILDPEGYGRNYVDLTNRVFSTAQNARYMRFYVAKATQYNHDICINLSDTAINGKYYPYIKRVEDLSIIRKYFPDGMKSAGSAHDEIRYNKASGKWEKVQRIGETDFSRASAYSSVENTFLLPIADMKLPTTTAERGQGLLCAKYPMHGRADGLNVAAMQDKAMLRMSNGNIYIKDSTYGADVAAFKAAMQGVILYYELAEPIVTELDEADQFRDLDYAVWNAGTEKAIAEGKSAPLAADITYGFNAIGKIKELESLVAALRAKVGI